MDGDWEAPLIDNPACKVCSFAIVLFSIWIDKIYKCLCTITRDFLVISLSNFVMGLCVSNKRYLLLLRAWLAVGPGRDL